MSLVISCTSQSQGNPLLRPDSHTRPIQTHTVSSTSLANLDDDVSQWGIFQDRGSAITTIDNVSKPSTDGLSLKTSLLGGQPFAGAHVYRNLAPANTAKAFEMHLSFYFTSLDHIQALEFTLNKWSGNQRWEWALQWERIGDGTPQQGNPPTWRLWTGKSWQDSGVRQSLTANTWHTLSLKGDSMNGQVHYISFTCDTIPAQLRQTFSPVSSPGEKLAVAVQLDGDSQEEPYTLYIDQVTLDWS